MRRNAAMLAKLIIFVVDLTLALAIFVILYAVYLLAAASIFISVLFYNFKGELEKNYDFNKGRVWGVDSSNATEKPFAGITERVSSRMLPVHFPAAGEAAFCPKRMVLSSKEQELSVVGKTRGKTCQSATPTQRRGHSNCCLHMNNDEILINKQKYPGGVKNHTASKMHV